MNRSRRVDLPRKVPRNIREKYIPRPRNCFMIFRSDFAYSLRQSHSQISQVLLSKEAGFWWNCLPPEERRLYEDQAGIELQEHREKYPDYRYKPRRCGGMRREDRLSEPYHQRSRRPGSTSSMLPQVHGPTWCTATPTLPPSSSEQSGISLTSTDGQARSYSSVGPDLPYLLPIEQVTLHGLEVQSCALTLEPGLVFSTSDVPFISRAEIQYGGSEPLVSDTPPHYISGSPSLFDDTTREADLIVVTSEYASDFRASEFGETSAH
ncbi:hypothetical protein NLI96_g1768 [Meripilus lineatus]|uniref:HMG box domain-containing protein n=1 Tax=Meripilus lineatus TaxID=2056292 RepID=A0AAD5YMN8_9APHY|nr:hypothetical protein NLI96_g1768 [Physisporinus lineatus]